MTLHDATSLNRRELIQRIELIEDMIAEGRQMTAGYGWIFVLWGVIELVPLGWHYLKPNSSFVERWSWPICLLFGVVITRLVRRAQSRKRGPIGVIDRSLGTVWRMTLAALAIYVLGAILSGFDTQVSYMAAVLVILGMAHATSSVILRWPAQGIVAGIWWLGAIATFFDTKSPLVQQIVFFAVVALGLFGFGIYAIVIDHMRRHGRVA